MMGNHIEVKDLPPLMTIKQAELTGAASGPQLRLMCRNKTLKAVKVGTDWRINRDHFKHVFGLE